MSKHCVEWDRPMTSKTAAKYFMTKGFVPVELYDAVIQRLADVMHGIPDSAAFMEAVMNLRDVWPGNREMVNRAADELFAMLPPDAGKEGE